MKFQQVKVVVQGPTLQGPDVTALIRKHFGSKLLTGCPALKNMVLDDILKCVEGRQEMDAYDVVFAMLTLADFLSQSPHSAYTRRFNAAWSDATKE